MVTLYIKRRVSVTEYPAYNVFLSCKNNIGYDIMARSKTLGVIGCAEAGKQVIIRRVTNKSLT